jgi:regulator of nucleoside diphosphate kinase
MQNQKSARISAIIILLLVLINTLVLEQGYLVNRDWYWLLLLTVPLLILAIANIRQKKHAILRNFPVIGYFRYFFEYIRPEIRPYYFESDRDGKRFNRRQRSIVYQRAKNERQTVAFGMQSNPDVSGWKKTNTIKHNSKLSIMKKINNELVLRTDDYKLLISYLNGGNGRTAFDRRNAEDLHAELKKAKLVNSDNFPNDVVRINSTVQVKAEDREEIMEFMLVTPDKANIKERKISIMAPIGTALIGFRKGQQVKWQVPAGKRTFTIIDVINDQ